MNFTKYSFTKYLVTQIMSYFLTKVTHYIYGRAFTNKGKISLILLVRQIICPI